MSTIAIVALALVASLLFPIFVHKSELGEDGRWRPRGRHGYITKKQAKLRYIWFYVAVWAPITVGLFTGDNHG